MLTTDPTLRHQDLLTFPKRSVSGLFRVPKIVYTYNGRGALHRIMRSLPPEKGRVVLVPAFHCAVLVEAILRAGYEVHFYNINLDLTIDYSDLCAKMSHDVAAVVVIHYFGFTTDFCGILALREKYDYYIIEDWAHSFLNAETGKLTGGDGDLAVFSFRKLVPTYAGGAVRININDSDFRCDSPDARIGVKRSVIIMKRLAEELIENCGEGLLRSTFRYMERKRIDVKSSQESPATVQGPWIDSVSHDDLATVKLPWFLKGLLHLSDFQGVIAARQENYRILDVNLKENNYIRKVLAPLPDHVCPWAYPVWVRDRKRYDVRLRGLGIPVFTFGDVLHPLIDRGGGNLASSVETLSKDLLMIPIHQNLTRNVVSSFCEKINRFFQELETRDDKARRAPPEFTAHSIGQN